MPAISGQWPGYTNYWTERFCSPFRPAMTRIEHADIKRFFWTELINLESEIYSDWIADEEEVV